MRICCSPGGGKKAPRLKRANASLLPTTRPRRPEPAQVAEEEPFSARLYAGKAKMRGPVLQFSSSCEARKAATPSGPSDGLHRPCDSGHNDSNGRVAKT